MNFSQALCEDVRLPHHEEPFTFPGKKLEKKTRKGMKASAED
jgi:hypothetical protein